MQSCTSPPVDAPIIRLTLVGTGEPLLRMERRLSCAAGGAGIRLMLEVCKNVGALGIAYADMPAVLHEGKVIFSGLPRTEEIEVWLKQLV
ncbi:hypothetical protein GALL_157320 [mine drainage metagenome]|uniref:Uncharacterized protein n=1 Tax=mine drainage metagenome TaxID=410659 RepID=A0A1J5S220_9ZZZZ